ncbi:MAG: hypothetical protein ACYCZA_05460 [Thiobacillus sp.]
MTSLNTVQASAVTADGKMNAVTRSHNQTFTKPVGWPVMAGLFLVTAVLAVFFGLVAVTANTILIALAAGLLVGTLLLGKPTWTMWLILSLGLLVSGVLPLFFEFLASKASWGVSILGFVLLASVFFKVATNPGLAKHTPGFVWVALAFMLLAVINSLAQWQGLISFIGGFKRYFQVWGLLFAMTWLVLDQNLIRRFLGFILIVALIQLPFALYELIKLVPIREGLVSSYPGMVPIDVVAGTFGASLYGGGSSGQMATFLIIVFAFLLARWHENALSVGRLAILSIFVLTPLFLGETKVVVILFPLMFLVLYRKELITRPHYALLGFAVITVMTIAAGYVYLGFLKGNLYDEIANTLSYNVYERGYGGYVLNRTTVFSFWLEHQGTDNPVSFFFGNGLGSVQSPYGSLTPGHIAMRYPTYGLGLNAGSTLLWDTGIVGFGLFLLIPGLAWLSANRLRRESTSPTIRADALAIQVAIILLSVHISYSLALLETLSTQIIFTMLLGYLAWLHRQHFNTRRSSP